MRRAAWVMLGALASPVAAQLPSDAEMALFEKGEAARVRVGSATTSIPATGFACANCHGGDGMGSQEGDTRMPSILWSSLSQDTPARPAYDAETLIRALTEGIGADGSALDLAMPRYDLPAETAAAMPKFLADLEVVQKAGVFPNRLNLIGPDESAGLGGFVVALATYDLLGGAHGRELQPVRAPEPAIFDFRLADEVLAQVRQAEIAALAEVAANDGETALAPFGIDPDEIAQPLALPIDRVNGAPLLVEQGPMPAGASTVYARRDALTSEAIAALAKVGADVRLVISDPFPDAAAWARRHGAGRTDATGYALGQMAGEAALAIGRDASRSRFAAALKEIARQPVATKEFTLKK